MQKKGNNKSSTKTIKNPIKPYNKSKKSKKPKKVLFTTDKNIINEVDKFDKDAFEISEEMSVDEAEQEKLESCVYDVMKFFNIWDIEEFNNFIKDGIDEKNVKLAMKYGTIYNTTSTGKIKYYSTLDIENMSQKKLDENRKKLEKLIQSCEKFVI